MILISTFNILLLVLIFCIYKTFPERDEEDIIRVGIKNLLFGFISPWLSYYLSQMIISNQVIETNEYSSLIVDSGLGWLLQFIAFATSIVFIYLLYVMLRSRTREMII